MSCSCTSPCGCYNTAPVTSCAYEDVGIENYLRHVGGYDRAFGPRRLANAPGVLTAQVDGSGGYRIAFSLTPSIAYTTFPISEGTKFGGMVAAMGENGTHRRITPTVGGLLLSSNADGTFELVSPTEATIPDDLDVDTVTTGTLTTQDITISGQITATALNDDTITKFVGLNASDVLVTGLVAGTAVAMFYENADLLDASTPNESVAPGAALTFTNTITDTSNLVNVVNSQKLTITNAGLYEFSWMASVDKSVSNNFLPDVRLALGTIDSIVNTGQFVRQTPNAGGAMTGQHVTQVSAGTGVWMKAGPECKTQCGIQRLQLIIRKIA